MEICACTLLCYLNIFNVLLYVHVNSGVDLKQNCW